MLHQMSAFGNLNNSKESRDHLTFGQFASETMQNSLQQSFVAGIKFEAKSPKNRPKFPPQKVLRESMSSTRIKDNTSTRLQSREVAGLTYQNPESQKILIKEQASSPKNMLDDEQVFQTKRITHMKVNHTELEAPIVSNNKNYKPFMLNPITN